MDFSGYSNSGNGIGDDKMSWGFDGSRQCLWHNGSRHFGEYWAKGDVLGVACDLEKRTISFCLNGNWAKWGVAYRNIDFTTGLSPGWTIQCDEDVEFGMENEYFRQKMIDF